MKRYSFLLIVILALICTSMAQADTTTTTTTQPYSSARYELVFDATWDKYGHPHPNGRSFFPSEDGVYGPHFSGLVGGTHNSDVRFWEINDFASPGIRLVAETGSQNILLDEIAQASNNVLHSFAEQGIRSPGTLTTTIDVDSNHPLVTAISMIAPSPDWFVGVHSFSLWNHNKWRETATVDLYPYDAGTKEGDDYDYRYPVSEPQRTVVTLKGVRPFSFEPLGRLTFTLIDTSSIPLAVTQQGSMKVTEATMGTPLMMVSLTGLLMITVSTHQSLISKKKSDHD